MFGKVLTITAFAATLLSQVHGHALVEPAIGVGKNGTGVRADVQRPSSKSPCGTVNVANVIKNSTAVFVDKDGVFSATGQNFNPYVSLQPHHLFISNFISASVDTMALFYSKPPLTPLHPENQVHSQLPQTSPRTALTHLPHSVLSLSPFKFHQT